MTKPTGRPRGRPRKDATVRAIHGDRPLPPPAVITTTCSDAPAGLSPAERERWDDYAEELNRLGRLTVLSRPVLDDLVRGEVLVAGMRAEIARDGLALIGQKGEKVRHPLLMPLSSCLTQVAACRTELGMGPLANSRYAPAKVEHDSSDLLTGGWTAS